MGEKQNQPFQLSFNASLKIDFQGSRVTSGSDGIARTVQQESRFRRPRKQRCLRKPIENATIAGVQDWRKAGESRSDHLGEGQCTEKGSVGDKRGYPLRRWNSKKRIPA